MVSVVVSRDMGNIKPGEIQYFRKGHKFPLGEGQVIEFKGHRNISEDNVPNRAVHMEGGAMRPSRTPAARALNSFINQEEGGYLYLGITDDREAHGFKMSVDQREHVRQEVYNVLRVCQPPVRPERVRVNCIPVIENLEQLNGLKQVERATPPVNMQDKHKLMTAGYCWCDKEASVHEHQWMIPTFVIEVVVLRRSVEDVKAYADDTGVPVEDLLEEPVMLFYKNEDGWYYERSLDSSCSRREDELIEYSMAVVQQRKVSGMLTEHKRIMEAVMHENGITDAEFQQWKEMKKRGDA